MDDTLDSLLTGSDDEAEEDAVISQVLDEIGIEVTGKVYMDQTSLAYKHSHVYIHHTHKHSWLELV